MYINTPPVYLRLSPHVSRPAFPRSCVPPSVCLSVRMLSIIVASFRTLCCQCCSCLYLYRCLDTTLPRPRPTLNGQCKLGTCGTADASSGSRGLLFPVTVTVFALAFGFSSARTASSLPTRSGLCLWFVSFPISVLTSAVGLPVQGS